MDQKIGVTVVSEIMAQFKKRAHQLKAESYVLYLAMKHPQTPWYARIFVALIVAYAFSPIDLIPDFIPILGYLDDLILVPLGILLAIRMVPAVVLQECRRETANTHEKPTNWLAAVVIVGLWLLLAGWGIVQIIRLVQR